MCLADTDAANGTACESSFCQRDLIVDRKHDGQCLDKKDYHSNYPK